MKSKLAIILILFSLSTACKREITFPQANNVSSLISNDAYIVFFENRNCTGKVKDSVIILFESGFENDLLEISFNDTIIKDSLTTDVRLDLSKLYELGHRNNLGNLKFRVNNGNFIKFDSINCNYILVNYKKNDSVKIKFANKIFGYR